eukprot:2618879-Prymnesium_polylepis.1
MPIRRLTRTPALPAASLSARLTPYMVARRVPRHSAVYGGAMRPEAHKSVGSAPNCTVAASVLGTI